LLADTGFFFQRSDLIPDIPLYGVERFAASPERQHSPMLQIFEH
jgi:hypothetical protein